MTIDEATLAALRKQFSPTPPPTCETCGAAMELRFVDHGGTKETWQCVRHRWAVYKVVDREFRPSATVVALVEAYETAIEAVDARSQLRGRGRL